MPARIGNLRTAGRPARVRDDRFYSRAPWKRVRDLALDAGPMCSDPFGTHARERAIVPAAEVDHIIPRHQRPDLSYTLSNLQPLCSRCHSRKTRMEMAGETPPCRAGRVVILAGPPGAGKTSEALRLMEKGDLIIDLDRILAALTCCPPGEHPATWLGESLRLQLLPLGLEVMEFAMRQAALLRAQGWARTMYVVGMMGSPEDRRRFAEKIGAEDVRVLAVPAEECKRRLRADPSRQGDLSRLEAAVDRWWRDHGI